MGKMPCLLPPLALGNRGGAVRDGGGPIRALWATAAAGIEGERRREVWGIDPLPHLGLGWRAEAARWERAAVGGEGCGGGVVARKEG